MIKNNYYFLHGFLGDENYFSKLKKQLNDRPSTGIVYSPSLFSSQTHSRLTAKHGFGEWAVNFNEVVKQKSKENNVLIGYSMGGRLGVHAFLADPSLWSRCFFVSSNPGLIKTQEKMARMAWEDGWCYQIDNKSWFEFIRLWNRQAIFDQCSDIRPEKQHYDINLLKLALKNWSLTKHKIDLNLINNKKLHWLVGEIDVKYQNIFKQLKSAYQLEQVATVSGVGHRFHLDLSHISSNS